MLVFLFIKDVRLNEMEFQMKKLISRVLIVLIFIAINNIAFAQTNYDNSSPNTSGTAATSTAYLNSDPQTDLRLAMRTLWEDHITYTRNYIISALANLGDVSTVANRLMQNQDDIGNAIKPYYGDEAGNKLSSLLREHIQIAGQVVKAAQTHNKKALDQAQQKWKNNANDIATFLSSANPNWSKADLTNMLYKHLDLTTGEVVARLNKNWKEDINSYDQGHEHMLMFADTLTAGIIKQFPAKFQ